MRVEFACQPAHTLAYCFLAYGESVEVEHGAMAMMSDGISVSMGVGGSLGAAVRRKVLGGERALTARYTAQTQGAWVAVAPRLPGDMSAIEVRDGVVCDRGSIVAWDSSVEVDVQYAGARAIVLREGAVLLHLAGSGTAVLGTYGGLQMFELQPQQEMVVDTGHLLAWDSGVSIKLGMVGGAATAALSGEGIVARMIGPGRVWCQTRSMPALEEWVRARTAPESR
jgi:uncharacterized protein (TIGR00266 family)